MIDIDKKGIIVVCVLMCMLFDSRAANRTWNGNTDANWNTAANWNEGGWTASSTAIFGLAGSSGTTLNNNIAGTTVNGITFNSSADSFTINGNSITLGGNIMVGAGITSETINFPITLSNNRIVAVNSGTLTLGGVISAGAAYGITKNGGGTLTLTNANTFSGGITLNTGTLKVLSGGSLNGNALTLGLAGVRGGCFVYDNSGTGMAATQTMASVTVNQVDNEVQLIRTEAQDVNLIFTGGAIGATGEDGRAIKYVVAGPGVTNGVNARIILGNQTSFRLTTGAHCSYFDGGNDCEFAVYDISGGTGLDGYVRGINYGVDPGSATSSGATFGNTIHQEITGSITGQGTVTLGNQTAGGVSNGTLRIVGASDLTMLPGAVLTIDCTLDTGSKGILKTGGGTSTISGGASIIQIQKNGVIRVDGPTDVLNIAMPFSFSVGQRYMKSGEGTLILSSGTVALGYTTWINGGVWEMGGGAIFNGGAYNISIANGALFRHNSSATTSSHSAVISGSGGVTVSAGKLTLSGVNTFSGRLTVDGGTLAVATMNNASASGPLGQSALPVILGKEGSSTGTLEYTGITAGSSKPFTLGTGGAGAFQIDTSDTILTISGMIDGGGSLVKTGPGTLKFTNINTYTGDTTVSDGTLSIDNAYLCDTSTVYIATGAKLDLNFTGSDTNSMLYLNGQVQAPGIYGASALGSSYFTGSGTITVKNGNLRGTMFVFE